jgi:hypothetical protein
MGIALQYLWTQFLEMIEGQKIELKESNCIPSISAHYCLGNKGNVIPR